MSEPRFWEPAVRELVGGRDVILAGSVPAVWVDYARELRLAGARKILVYATEGAGLMPGPDAPTVVVDQPGNRPLLERVRASNRLISEPPPDVRRVLDEFDPHHEALVIASFLNEAPALDERAVLAYRRPEWVALEDKTTVDALWDRAGVARRPSCVVPVGDAPQAATGLDEGHGTVWAGDARDGYHGGAALTRWVHDAATRAAALADLTEHCDHVRVMPYIPGVACSIHAIVLPDGTAVLRPVEMVTLQHRGGLLYAGCATFWDPPPHVREHMRETARRTATLLGEEVGFRGTFTVDGIATADGFWPTELNPRFGAGIGTLARAAAIPMLLVHDLAVAGHSPGITATAFEHTVVTAADAKRGGGTWLIDRPTLAQHDARDATFDGSAWHWAAAGASPHATFVGGADFARCTFDPAHTPVGPSVAPRAAAFWNFVGPQLYADLGPVSAPIGTA